MPTKALTSLSVLVLVYAAVALALPVSGSAQEQLRYRLIDLGTLGGPQSFGDGGHNAANINNEGIAAGAADTATLNPNFPNFGLNGINGPDGSLDPFVHHAFLARNGVLTDLGTLPGAYNSSSPTWVTENGWVSGVSLNGSIDPVTGWIVQHAVVWKDGEIIDLGTVGGFESGTSQVNSKGQVTGFSTNDVPDPFSLLYLLINGGFTNGTQTRAFRWDSANGMHDLGTLGGPDAEGFAINERGQILGASDTNSTLNPVTQNFTVEPFLWENGTMTGLGTLGGTFGFPSGLNNRGEVNGTSNLAGDTCTHVFLWSAPGPMRDLGSPLGGCVQGEVAGITDTGEFVGQGTTAGEQKFHAFIWKNGTFTDLGSLPDLDDTCVGAFGGPNSRGQVVGQAIENLCHGPRAHAFIWQDGRMTDLNVFVPPSSDLTLVEVEKINDRGEMFGTATTPSGDSHAFLLVPCEQGHEGCVDSADAAVRNEARPTVSAATTRGSPEGQRALIRNFRNHWMARYHGLASVPGK
jgi:probable HAF family extracellular repeat protein